jgi:hypothetical protein
MHHVIPNVNGSIRGRGINRRSLTVEQRCRLAAAALAGELSIRDLSAAQASMVFGVSIARIHAARRQHREATPAA